MITSNYGFVDLSGLIATDDLISCYEKEGKPDGQADVGCRTRKQKVGLVSRTSLKFVTKPSDNISEIADEFSQHLPYSREAILEALKTNHWAALATKARMYCPLVGLV